MSEQLKPFEIQVGGQSVALSLGNCAVVLFRRQQEVDYICVNIEVEEDGKAEDAVLRIFRNEDVARYMAGMSIREVLPGRFMYDCVEFNHDTFHEEYGWSPPVIIKNAPNEDEQQWFADVEVAALDREWEEFESDET